MKIKTTTDYIEARINLITERLIGWRRLISDKEKEVLMLQKILITLEQDNKKEKE